VPLSKTGAELLFELISQRDERGATLITSNLPFDEWTETFGSERLTGALLDRLTHHVNILEMNGESYRPGQSKARQDKAEPLPQHRKQLALTGQSIRATASSRKSAVARMLALSHAAISPTPKCQHFALPFGALLLCR
jgi:hypothetical protein